jgi:hypothetical protein
MGFLLPLNRCVNHSIIYQVIGGKRAGRGDLPAANAVPKNSMNRNGHKTNWKSGEPNPPSRCLCSRQAPVLIGCHPLAVALPVLHLFLKGKGS